MPSAGLKPTIPVSERPLGSAPIIIKGMKSRMVRLSHLAGMDFRSNTYKVLAKRKKKDMKKRDCLEGISIYKSLII
jgi:hypothetical protein